MKKVFILFSVIASLAFSSYAEGQQISVSDQQLSKEVCYASDFETFAVKRDKCNALVPFIQETQYFDFVNLEIIFSNLIIYLPKEDNEFSLIQFSRYLYSLPKICGSCKKAFKTRCLCKTLHAYLFFQHSLSNLGSPRFLYLHCL